MKSSRFIRIKLDAVVQLKHPIDGVDGDNIREVGNALLDVLLLKVKDVSCVPSGAKFGANLTKMPR